MAGPLKSRTLSTLKISPQPELAMMFTCKVCETRSVKPICRKSYEKGTALVLCDGCNNYHLISDHLGIFDEKGPMKDLMAACGKKVLKGKSTLELTHEDLAGMTKS